MNQLKTSKMMEQYKSATPSPATFTVSAMVTPTEDESDQKTPRE
jgi:hypothetical protein